MERMWRKVNQGFGVRSGSKFGTMQSTDTVSSAGGFGDNQIVVAVSGMPSSTATGRRLAASGQITVPTGIVGVGPNATTTTAVGGNLLQKSLSQHVLANSTASSTERRRRRRRKSRPRRTGVTVSCVSGGGGDNMSSSGGFYTMKEFNASNHRHHRQSQSSSNRLMASSAPSGTVMMYPNPSRELSSVTSGAAATSTQSQTQSTTNTINTNTMTNSNTNTNTATVTGTATASAIANVSGNVATTSATVPDISLRQRAVAKLRMFNFHLNWDLHMTHCKPCGPRLSSGSGGSSSGNMIMRRLCRNRRREDNELYRSNSFKFERFERKECIDDITDTLQKKIAICDDYSLPVDFVKKRPSSFDPTLAEAFPTNIESWAAPSPQTEFVNFTEASSTQRESGEQQDNNQQKQQQQQQQQQEQQEIPTPPPPPAPLSTLPSAKAAIKALAAAANNTNSQQQQQQTQTEQTNSQKSLVNQRSVSNNNNSNTTNNHNKNQHKIQARQLTLPTNAQHHQQQQQQLVFPHAIKHASVKLIEGYSDPKDSKRHRKVYHKKGKRRVHHNKKKSDETSQQQQQEEQEKKVHQLNSAKKQATPDKDKRSNYSSDSSAPKSSDDEEELDNESVKIPELNSPDSISDDLVRPLQPLSNRSPRKLNAGPPETSKRNPSPYYYSDLLKNKDTKAQSNSDKEAKTRSRQSTASEPPQLTHSSVNLAPYRKSTSLDVPTAANEAEAEEDEDDFEVTEPTSRTIIAANDLSKRYSFTEEGVHIIRCDSPSTSTDSEESDCSECQKRREWHARELALVRKTCNVQPLNTTNAVDCHYSVSSKCLKRQAESGEPQQVNSSMPPHRLLGPAVCACVAPANLGDDIDEYFRPRSIFYVHANGASECVDCAPEKLSNSITSRSLRDASSLAHSDNTLDEENDDEMSGRTRQIYETAFDCKIAKSDDDLDEVDRITNHSVLLELNNGNNVNTNQTDNRATKSSKSRLEGKRLKNSKNQAIQEQTGSTNTNATDDSKEVKQQTLEDGLTAVATDISNMNLGREQLDQQNNSTANNSSASQLPMRGYTPSPPSTAPLPMKFPGKQNERYFMNSIKSAPNLPSSNPAHPRLRDLRLPIQSSLRQQQHLSQQSSLATSNEHSLTDSAFVNAADDKHHHHHQHHQQSAAVNGSRARNRPRSFVLESGRVMELRRSHGSSHHHHVGNGTSGRRTTAPHNYSSTESIATSSSGGSMESLRSSTSEGNRSTSSSESRHSTSLSSHSSESGSSSVAFPLRAPVLLHSKLHILSPISDKSSQEPSASEVSDANKTVNASPEENHGKSACKPVHGHTVVTTAEISRPPPQLQIEALKKRRPAANKTLMQLTDEILGSDSGISLHSREDGKAKFTLPKLNLPAGNKATDSGISGTTCNNSNTAGLPQDLRDLPFDMPKLRRRKTIQQDTCTSGSATSVDLGDLPFDMPKLRRRLRANQSEINNLMVHSTESSGISQASSSHSMTRDDNKTSMRMDTAMFRQNLTLNLNEPRQSNKFGSLDLRGHTTSKELNLNLSKGFATAVDLIDVSIPLERQGWYHGSITRIEAESTLRPLSEGSFLVRNCESTKQDYSLSLKGAKGFMHMRIQRNDSGQYILGQFSRPFETVPEMIRHFCLNRLPVRGAEHMCLIEPVIVQLL